MQVQESLEVFFCDLCNASVPERDLETGVAARVKGKVVGACCLGELRPPAPRPVAAPGTARAGPVAAAVVVLAAVAGGTMFLDWRLADEAAAAEAARGRIEGELREQRQRLPGIEGQLATRAAASDLHVLQQQLADSAQGQVDRELRLKALLEGVTGRIDLLGKEVEQVRRSQGEQTASVLERVVALSEDVSRLGQEVAEALAAAQAAPAAFPPPAAEPPAGDAPPAAAAEPGLPAELAEEVEKLKDSDPGVRFEAVDRLIQSKNPAVLPALIPLARDEDFFVRRLTVEGLGAFVAQASVETLIASLDDSHSIIRHTALASLRKLTGQDIEFDVDGRPEERRNGQRRWQDWWEKNRDRF